MNRQTFLRYAAKYGCLFLTLLMMSPTGLAKNADQSDWLYNISESAMADEPGHQDDNPEIAISGTTVHVLWAARKADNFNEHVLYYRRSTDLGKTWQPKIQLMASKEVILLSRENRKLTVSGNTVHIFQNHYRGSWYGVLTYFRSTDNGASFEPAKDILTAESAHHIYDIYAHAEKNYVYLAYVYQRNWEVKDSIALLVSENQGNSFASRPIASFDKDLGDDHPRLYDMQAQGTHIALVYGDAKSYYGLRRARLFAAVSTDGGQKFHINKIDVPSNENSEPKSYASTSENYAPKIAFGGKNVYVVFHAIDEEGKNAVFFRRSMDGGQTFSAAQSLSQELKDRTVECCHETIAAHNEKVYVLFLDKQGNLYFKRSLNGGVSFDALKELTAPGDTTPYGKTAIAVVWWPRILLDPNDSTGSRIHVTATHLFHVYSDNAGTHFSAPVTLYSPFGFSDLSRVKTAIDDNGALHLVAVGHTTWYTTGVFGDPDIFYRRFHHEVASTTTQRQALRLQHHKVRNDGSGIERWDTLVIPSESALQFKDAFTVEAWIKVNRMNDSDGYFLYKTDPGKDGAWGSILLGQWRNGNLDGRITTENAGYVVIADRSIANGVWTHVAMSYDATSKENNLRLYINGELTGKATAQGKIASSIGPYLIGGGSERGEAYQELIIDELRLWQYARSQDEIRATMRQALNGKEPGLVAYYPFDEPFTPYGTVRDMAYARYGILQRKEQLTEGYALASYTGMKITAPRSLVDAQNDARLYAEFVGEDQGDLYIAAMIGGQPNNIFFLDERGAFHLNRPLPFRRNGRFTGALPIFTIPGASIPQGRYRLYAVVTDAGADIFDFARWHGPIAQFLFIAHEKILDQNQDGWADDDRNRDGFLDNDRNFDGYPD